MNPILGVILHAIGGFAAGSFYTPCKKIKGWSWETYWLVLGVFAWIITPLVMGMIFAPGYVDILSSSPLKVILWTYFFGVLWGIGGLTFGLTMRYLGISLGVSVALGLCALFGTLIPPIYEQFFGNGSKITFSVLLSTVSGRVTLAGIGVCLAGIIICGKAGMMKEKELSPEEKTEGVREFHFFKGLWVATVAGVLSACFAFALAAGKPIQELGVENGVENVFSNIPLLIVILLGGFTTNCVWCLWLGSKNKTFSDYIKADGGSVPVNYILCMTAGVLWYLQFFFYGMGSTQMGKYDFASWTLHMAFIIITSNAIGLLMKEWKGSSRKTILYIMAGIITLILSTVIIGMGNKLADAGPADGLASDFKSPPDSARPGVYWYFMDGNLSGKEMTADLESMKEAGLGNLVFLEVNVGVPRGPIDFMSDKWQELFAHAVAESERLGIDITLGSGPGWTGSGGPWVKPEQAMQFLLSSVTETKGPSKFDAVLAMPQQHTTPWGNMRTDFYEDVFVFAFPKCAPIIADINEKALYDRFPYTSHAGVKEFLPAPAKFDESGRESIISFKDIIDISEYLDSDGRLQWAVPDGAWTIVRMVRRATCASTRPAPQPGVGLECDKFDTAALDHHFANYYGKLLEKVGARKGKNGWTTIHMDSWEMGSQNWTKEFLAKFEKRRGYDAKPYLLAYTGRAVETLEISGRFLWDVRLTCQELVLENHAGHLKELGRKHGFELSIEPYDMNPTADLDLGAVADVPMCEFWSEGMGFDSSFSCIEATSIAHTMGRSIVSAEAFTANSSEGWRQYPWSMKNQGDWAFCMGINRFVYHTFAHKPLGEEYRPGMTMGPYGVHWDRGQTWWPMVKDYHEYVSRCSHLMRQGVTVSDILYLTPEGAPHVFRAPASALEGTGPLADKKGYGFDGCSPNILMARAEVKEGRIEFPGGTSYSLMVLPEFETMTPEFLAKIAELVKAGATIIGSPPVKSPSLSGYPECDDKVRELAKSMWGSLEAPAEVTKQNYGQGAIYWGGALSSAVEFEEEAIIAGSTWIWYPEGNPAGAAPAETRYFKRTINVDKDAVLASARAAITADNSFTLSINGKQVEQGDNFNILKDRRIEQFLRPGSNVLAIAATNAGPGDNPAGLIAAFELKYKDGSKEIIYTDKSWSTSLEEEADWRKTPDVPADWKAAIVLGPSAMRPWGLSPTKPLPELYPYYADTAVLLKEMGISEDFTSTGPVRYGHRSTGQQEIYFVSNKTGDPVEADCTFRVAKSNPQLWNPVTGDIRELGQYKVEDGLTTVPMEFAPYESFFVIFAHEDSAKPSAEESEMNFPDATPVGTLQGTWDVSFDPKWGGPVKATFDTLHDWTQSDERGIKYYSGIATYSKIFNRPEDTAADAVIYLDLGTVHDMARVILNGKDLGVVWCAPWRVEISDALKIGNNNLEIEVVNRWSNRMIGDQQPPDANVRTVQWPDGFLGGKEYKTGRYTFATSSAHNQLLPSGLLGPVRIMVRKELQADQ